MRTALMVAVAVMGLTACAGMDPVAGRADNNMLRFSAMDYAPVVERDW
ncbi:hypothetical protein [Salipiger sp. IMCC34102]|nr:hypothetical protein [Salipiger sp. IMCC34102]